MLSRNNNKIYDIVKPYTMTSRERVENLLKLVYEVDDKNIEGSLVECGVWKCGMLGVMSLANTKNRNVYGFDSFEGLPAPQENDGNTAIGWEGTLKVSLQEACINLKNMGANASLIKGFFNDTLRNYKQQIGKISVLRLDGDWYESTMTCLDELYDLVSPGGFIIIDDYGHWEGCRKATDDFRAKRNIFSTMNQSDYTEVWWKKE
jgi:hypothetical protein